MEELNTNVTEEVIEKAAGNGFVQKVGIVAIGALAVYGAYKATTNVVRKIKDHKAAKIEAASEVVEVEESEED